MRRCGSNCLAGRLLKFSPRWVPSCPSAARKFQKISRYSQVLEVPCLQHSVRFTYKHSALLFLVQQPQLLQLLVYLQLLLFLSTVFSSLVVHLCCPLLTLESKPLPLAHVRHDPGSCFNWLDTVTPYSKLLRARSTNSFSKVQPSGKSIMS